MVASVYRSLLFVVSCFLMLKELGAEFRQFVNNGHQDGRTCGCPPDAALGTKYDTRAFVFAGAYYWFIDIFEDTHSISSAFRTSHDWVGLTEDLDAAFSAFNTLYFVKGTRFWIFNDNMRILGVGDTKEWPAFPKSVNSAYTVAENSSSNFSQIAVISDIDQFKCFVDRSGRVKCDPAPEEIDYFDDLDAAVGTHIYAATQLNGGGYIFFGTDSFCVILPPHPQCITFCNPIAKSGPIFPCPPNMYSALIITAIVTMMIVSCIVIGLFYCENSVRASNSRRGQ